jgi:hypothetical protein|uniref:Uncharacterized protein n=1 Tax=Myoviridae sp. ct2cn10 TaxID=2825022 RepID=A0A8S5PBG5_9CAUD|nr:hypothetical protein [uncultured Lachnoclostridium sp.]DAE03949.1 MAG TPA: hypothetical protein [Myoviridae sp. ct2cn10]
MEIEEVIRELMPTIKELEEEFENSTLEDFETAKVAMLEEIAKRGKENLTIIMKAVLSVVEDNLKNKRLKKQYAKELNMIGNQTAFWQHKEFIGDLELITDGSVLWKMLNAFDWGYIQGIRAERARRKKHVQREGLGA